jgi:hypothetical protein
VGVAGRIGKVTILTYHGSLHFKVKFCDLPTVHPSFIESVRMVIVFCTLLVVVLDTYLIYLLG